MTLIEPNFYTEILKIKVGLRLNRVTCLTFDDILTLQYYHLALNIPFVTKLVALINVRDSASEMTYIVSSGALNSTHSLNVREPHEAAVDKIGAIGISVNDVSVSACSSIYAILLMAQIQAQLSMTSFT